MAKSCDNKSVGVVIRDGDLIAIIKRINYPISFAFVAGHLDGETAENQAKNEAREEANIIILALKELLHKTYKNPCKRDGGHGHEWTVFEATKWEGVLRASSDAKEAFWVKPDDLEKLVNHTLTFLKERGVVLEDSNVDVATKLLAEDAEWLKNPGIEPVWCLMLTEIGIV